MVNKMSSLPPHPEVAGALARLRETTLSVVALTNSVQSVAEAQLTNAGIRGYFDDVMSADAVKRLKPAPEPYQAVARAFDVDTADVRLVAAHSWDVSGALAAGCKAAFVAGGLEMLSIGTPLAAVVRDAHGELPVGPETCGQGLEEVDGGGELFVAPVQTAPQGGDQQSAEDGGEDDTDYHFHHGATYTEVRPSIIP
jgi:beta-phosphoglucomutase-like phosphatase (HAD superfamily)